MEKNIEVVVDDRTVRVTGTLRVRDARAAAARELAAIGQRHRAELHRSTAGELCVTFRPLEDADADPYTGAVRCPYCGSETGRRCRTASGQFRAQPHRSRWDTFYRRIRGGVFLMILVHDDPQFGLAAGDELVCINYPWDAKYTVLYRLSDGFEPQCNQYSASLSFLHFLPEGARTVPAQEVAA